VAHLVLLEWAADSKAPDTLFRNRLQNRRNRLKFDARFRHQFFVPGFYNNVGNRASTRQKNWRRNLATKLWRQFLERVYIQGPKSTRCSNRKLAIPPIHRLVFIRLWSQLLNDREDDWEQTS